MSVASCALVVAASPTGVGYYYYHPHRYQGLAAENISWMQYNNNADDDLGHFCWKSHGNPTAMCKSQVLCSLFHVLRVTSRHAKSIIVNGVSHLACICRTADSRLLNHKIPIRGQGKAVIDNPFSASLCTAGFRRGMRLVELGGEERKEDSRYNKSRAD